MEGYPLKVLSQHRISTLKRPSLDFARSVAHPSVLNTGAPIGFTDNILGGSDVVSPYVAITKGF